MVGCDPHKDFGIVNEAEVDVLLEYSCVFYDPADVGNLISGSSAFSKSSLNIWISVHVLLKPSLENFEHYFVSVWDECNCTVLWTLFDIAFCWWRNETPTLQSGLDLFTLTLCFLQLLYFISFVQQSTGQVAKHYDLVTIQCAGVGRENLYLIYCS